MNTHFRRVICIAALTVFAGCEREKVKPNVENASGVDAAGEAQPMRAEKLADDAVLMKCGTNEFTYADAKRIADLRVKIMKISSPSVGEVKDKSAFVARALSSAVYGFPRDCAVADFVAEKGIAVSDEILDYMRKNAMVAAHQDFSSWGSFQRKFTEEERKTLNERVGVEAAREAVRRWYIENCPSEVTDEEIANYRLRQRDYNAMATATNDLIFAQATNVWREIEGGLAFDEAVSQYSTDEAGSDDGEWGDFTFDYFNDMPEVQNLLTSLTPGQVSPPVEGDNGLMIFRIDDIRDEGDGKQIYTISRIFFHLPEFYPELDDETFANEIRKARQNRLFTDFISELTTKQQIAYPNGETIFEDAKRTAAQPVMM